MNDFKTIFEDKDQEERIAKRMARAGLCSRRDAEKWILAKRVVVDGVTIDTPAFKVSNKSSILVDGNTIPEKEEPRLWRYHKPPSQITTTRDVRGRTTVFENLPKDMPRVVSVGRLDYDSEGLLLLTNDGEVTHRLAHPSFEIDKVYTATVSGVVTPSEIALLLAGVELEDGIARADKAKIMGEPRRGMSIVELVLHSGKNRVVRRMLKAIGHPVKDLHRRQFGPLHLGGLKPGAWRDLTRVEVTNLLTMAYRDQVFIKEQGDDRDD